MVRYEWDVEECNAVETTDLDEGEVIDHRHCETYTEVKRVLAETPPPGSVWSACLVRDDDNGRSWAYMEDGKLPEYFEDAYQHPTAKVPQRFHAEVLKAEK